ncbi:MAG: excinuclease ABC subunit UvrC [Candidatus Bipolaricaulia bacterium]
MMRSDEPLNQKLKLLPDRPGVYLMRDAEGEVIYVGKAASLKSRVRSYFQVYHQRTDRKVRALAESVADLEYIVTDSEVEALALEENLIKGYQPRYNVRLKDDKRFPYLKVTVNEPYPRLLVTREVEKDGARYFGPYTNVQRMRETVNLLRRLFPIRTCNDRIEAGPTRDRPCLDYFIEQCTAPCVARISQAVYREKIKALFGFLEGHPGQILKQMRQEMAGAAERFDYERAARLRDQIADLERLVGERKTKGVSSSELDERDAIGLTSKDGLYCIQIFFVRDGRVRGREYLLMEAPEGTRVAEVLAAFLKRFYVEATTVPKEILLPEPIGEEETVIATWLGHLRGGKVDLRVPQRGSKRRLVRLATRNAELMLFEEGLKAERLSEQRQTALHELQERLGLGSEPRRIECYDISNIQGSDAVGAMVVFENGLPTRSDYRRFRIREVSGPDDYAMMGEMLRRRLWRALRELEAIESREAAERRELIGRAKFAVLPDLIVVDGGKGQLGVARRVLQELNLEGIPTIALAKQFEHVFTPGNSEPLVLPHDTRALQLLQHIRDEAHRFALGYHRLRRERRALQSALDGIPGVGPKRKQMLIEHFGSVAEVREANLEELLKVPGLPRRVAEQIYKKLGGGREAGGSGQQTGD